MTVHGRSAIERHRSRAGGRTSSAASGVRRDVGGANEATVPVLSGSVLRLAQREVVHVELIGHNCSGVSKVESVRIMVCRVLG